VAALETPLEALVSYRELVDAAPPMGSCFDPGQMVKHVLRGEVAAGRIRERSGAYALNLSACDAHTVAALAQLRDWR
jgi:hypothetical protein